MADAWNTQRVNRTTEGRPWFAFAFQGGRGRAVRDLDEFDVAASSADFMWAHLDLRDAAAQAWLRGRPWPPDVIETAAAPIQRGRLFITPDMLYGHLRDFRDEATVAPLQAGSLCIVISRRLVVTGRRLPLRSIAEVRRRVEAGTAMLASPFGLITEFFRALNDGGRRTVDARTPRAANAWCALETALNWDSSDPRGKADNDQTQPKISYVD